MRIALGQINCTVGDLSGNVSLMLDASRKAADRGAELIAFPELSITGYPPRDLVEKQSFLERTEEQLDRLARETADLDLSVICGYVGRSTVASGKPRHQQRRRSRARAQSCSGRTRCCCPPTMSSTKRATSGPPSSESSVHSRGTPRRAHHLRGRLERQAVLGAPPLRSATRSRSCSQPARDLLISINASPYHMGKRALRRDIFAAAARRYGSPVVYVNQVGGNDQLVFDGTSFAMDAAGDVIASARFLRRRPGVWSTPTPATGDLHENLADECEAAYEALVLGTRDYIRKCGFKRVLIGLSGGIDSVADRGDRRRCRRPRERHRRRHAGPVLLRITASRDARDDGGEPRHSLRNRLDHRRRTTRVATRARSAVCRRAARCHRGESAVAPARRDADGALEQVGRTGADHRQQERARRRLLHALRRHVRRPRRDQRRAQDAGLPAVARRQPPPRGRHSGERLHQAAFRRAAPGSEGHRFPARPTTCSTRFSRPTSRSTSPPQQIADETRTPARAGAATSSTKWTATNTSASRPRRA